MYSRLVTDESKVKNLSYFFFILIIILIITSTYIIIFNGGGGWLMVCVTELVMFLKLGKYNRLVLLWLLFLSIGVL